MSVTCIGEYKYDQWLEETLTELLDEETKMVLEIAEAIWEDKHQSESKRQIAYNVLKEYYKECT